MSEEGGNHTGITDALNFIKGDACIVGEPSIKNHIDIGCRGVYRLKIISKGKSAHTGGLHSEGINSIINMNKLLIELGKIKYPTKNKAFPPFKITPSIIEGGVAINMVPDFCNLFVDCRLTYGQTKGSVLKGIREIVRNLGIKDRNASFSIEELVYIPPAAVDRRKEIVKKALKSAEHVLKEKQKLRIGGGASDANLLVKNGIPSVQLGPLGANTHSENEFVYVKSILDYAKIYALIAVDYLKGYNLL